MSTIGNSSSLLGKDQFLQLFVAQAQNQNPLEPMDNTEFMTQVAQFTQVEQLSNMSTNFEAVMKLTEFNSATGLIGHMVTFIDAYTGYSTEGVVDGVTMSNGEVYLEVGDQFVLPSAITAVRSV